MDLPPDVLVIILSYLTPNDVIESSAVCKLFYRLSRTKKLYNNRKSIYFYYENVFLTFSNQLFQCLKDISEDNLLLAKDVIMGGSYYSPLAFRERSHYTIIMCKYCT